MAAPCRPPRQRGTRTSSSGASTCSSPPPLDLARSVDIIALGLFDTAPERLQQLRARGTTTLCHMSAGLWETWRPDAPRFPETALGRSPTGWPGERWLDV